MATIEQIMKGLAAAVDRVQGLSVTPTGSAQINPPHAVIGVPAITDYDQATDRLDLEFTITVLTSAALDQVGQLRLASFANPSGPTSVPAAVEDDRQLGGVVEDCMVTGFRPLGFEEVGAIGYFGGVFTVQVMAHA